MENEIKTSGGNNAIPVAIVIAGLLIAGALYFRAPAASQPVAVKEFNLASLAAIIKAVKVDTKEYEACLANNQSRDRVAAQAEQAGELGAQGTPFPIVVTKSGKTAALPGAIPLEQLKQILDLALADNLPTESLTTTWPIPFPYATSTDHLNGNPAASVVVIEYSDLDCPYCKEFHETMNQVMSEYGADGRVAWVYRHFPLNIHPEADEQAVAAECVAAQGGEPAFWDFIDRVFKAH